MALHLFNTLTRRKEPLVTLVRGKVSLYLCGPTVYDGPHLGHARSAVAFDVMVRYLKAKGYAVTYVRNVTDIDDKIIARARRHHTDYRALGAHCLHRYHAVLERLNVRCPDVEPRASDYLVPIQNCISALVKKGHAYASGGDVYFSVASFKAYGRLSGRNLQTVASAQVEQTRAGKRHPADFSLWKKAKPDEPCWNSPWGPGRPGWHIECSAMSSHLLGDVFDIHGGGTDLIFPHHDNEIAQSEGITGKTPANYWIHNGLVYIGGQKMSKSVGNALNLEDLLEQYPSEALRLFLLSKRYRHPIEFSHTGMNAAAKRVVRLSRFFSRIEIATAVPVGAEAVRGALWSRFCDAMDDDFNFSMALSIVSEAVRDVNRSTGGGKGSRSICPSDGRMTAISDLFFIWREILGFESTHPAQVSDPGKSSTSIRVAD